MSASEINPTPQVKPYAPGDYQTLDGRKGQSKAERIYNIPQTICVAKKRNGEPCRMTAIPGYHLCTYHAPAGGKKAKKLAAERLAIAALPAVDQMIRLLKNKDAQVRFKASREIIAYTIPRIAQHMEVTAKVDHTVSTDALRRELKMILAEATSVAGTLDGKEMAMLLEAGQPPVEMVRLDSGEWEAPEEEEFDGE